jgi:hypothetical protein
LFPTQSNTTKLSRYSDHSNKNNILNYTANKALEENQQSNSTVVCKSPSSEEVHLDAAFWSADAK